MRLLYKVMSMDYIDRLLAKCNDLGFLSVVINRFEIHIFRNNIANVKMFRINSIWF